MPIFVMQYGETALYIASFKARLNVVMFLIHHGANVNIQDNVRNYSYFFYYNDYILYSDNFCVIIL